MLSGQDDSLTPRERFGAGLRAALPTMAAIPPNLTPDEKRTELSDAHRRGEHRVPDPFEHEGCPLCCLHEYGEWEDDPVGVVRECGRCGDVDWRPGG